MTDTPYELWCLVKGDTVAFPVFAPPETSIALLKQLIHEVIKDVLQGVYPRRLVLAKVNVDFKTHGDELLDGKYKPITYDRLGEWSTVAEVWPDRPPNRHLHIFVIPPQTDKLSLGSVVSTGTYEPHITVHIIGEKFSRQDIQLNGINEIGNPDSFPDFFQNFLEQLDRKRPGHPVLMTEWVIKHVDEEVLMKHFNFEDKKADFASGAELEHYLYAIRSNNERKLFFKESKEVYAQRLLVDLADELALLSSNKGKCYFGTSWPFHLVVERGKGSKQFTKYTPKSNFSMLIRDLPHCLLEVSSNPRKETDRWRILLQASCLARLAANKLRKKGSNPPIIMTVYINEAMEAEEYLFFKDDGSNEVQYRTEIFDLASPVHALQFIFRLYNFITFMVDADSELSNTLKDQLKDAKAEVSAKSYETFTAAQRKYDGNDSGSHNTRSSPEGQQRQRSPCDDPAMQTTLGDAGYVLIPELSDDPIKNPLGLKPVTPLKPTIRRTTSANGVSVILKLLDDDTDELTFLRYFKENNAIANHVIDFMGVLDLSVGTVVSFPAGTRLDEGLRFGSFPDAVGSLRIQFLEGVAFLHEHKVAHLDLNPNNVIVSGARSPSLRLSIIDFGLSMFVEDENTVTRGYRGTRGWVAPEIGTLDGPAMTYSAMGADRWACGRMIDYFEKYIRVEDRSRNMEMGRWSALLLSENARMRPSLREVLSGHRTATDDGAKRKTNLDGLDLTHKRARLSSTQDRTQDVGHID